MQPEKAEEVNAWIAKAGDDLRGAEIDLAAQPPLLSDVVFHSQQAAEKAMKAFLTANDSPFRKTHDLEPLAAACIAFAPSLRAVLESASNLTPYAWQFRYPGEATEPTLDEAIDAFARARAAVTFIRECLETVDG